MKIGRKVVANAEAQGSAKLVVVEGGGGCRVAPGLEKIARELSLVKPDAENVRKHGRRNLDSIKAALRRFGQRTPLVVSKKGMIVRKGNGTLEAMKELGWSKAAYLVVEEDAAEAVAYAIADNRTAELAEWDLEALAGSLRDLPPELADVAGYDEEELAQLFAQVPEVDLEVEETDAAGEVVRPGKVPEGMATADTPPSDTPHVKMVQLFFDPTQHAEFETLAERLTGEFTTDNLTDTVMEAMRRATQSLDPRPRNTGTPRNARKSK